MAALRLKRVVSMKCPACGAERRRSYTLNRKARIRGVHCRECKRYAPWYKWSFDHVNGLNLR